MNPIIIGSFIARKRKEKNMTQAQLAERLGVSNKTVSKWETGKSMPDYSVIESLCKELDISMAELMQGKAADEGGDGSGDGSSRDSSDDSQLLDLIKRIQILEQQRVSLYGLILLIMGMALLILQYHIGGSTVKDFISGFLLGISVVEMLVGVYVTVRGISSRN